MHQHNCSCDHNLKYCGHCDVVYCTKCGREWGRYYYNSYPWTYTTVGGSAIGGTINCTHSGGSYAL